MSTNHQDLRERIAATLASHDLPDNTDRDGQWAADALIPLIAADLDTRWEEGRRHGLTEVADHFITAHDVAAQGRDLIIPPDHMRKRANEWMRYLRWAADHVRAYAQGTAPIAPTEADRERQRQELETLRLQLRVAELEEKALGTLARRCSIPDCPASYDAVDGPPPEEQPPNRHWMLSPSPSLTLCPDHSHLWPTHRPRLDHTTRLASCECGHPLPGPTLGHMGVAWIAHALTVLEGESPLGVYWDKLVERDGQGGVYAFCTAWTGRPVYLAMKEEDAEALAGSLLNTPDGDEAAHCTDPAPHAPHEYADDTDLRHCTGTATAPTHTDHTQ